MIHPDVERVALLGWRLYPASSKDRRACFKGATDAATCDLNILARWTDEFPRCNWRVVMSGSGIWALDCDSPTTHAHDGVAALARLVSENTPLPKRPTARTGGNGLAIFFRHTSERIIGDSGHPADGIDPRRGRQSQTIPPSIHTTTGKAYRWITPPWECAPPDAPGWLLKALEPPPLPTYRPWLETAEAARNRLYRAACAVAEANDGARNATLNRRAFSIGHLVGAGLVGEVEATSVLYAAARHAGLTHQEATNTIKSGIVSGMRRGTSGRDAA